MSNISIKKDYASGLIRFHTIDTLPYIGYITIHNPTKRNALSRAMWFGLSDILDDCLVCEQSIRVLIITGDGSIAFSSGADLTEKNAENSDQYIPKIRVKLRQYPIPVIAQINGYCLGGGLALAMNTDIRIASCSSTFSIPAVKLGVPCPKAIVDRLIELVGQSNAKMILFTGDRISAQQALTIGLIQHVCDDLNIYVLEFARNIAHNAPLAIQTIKLMIEHPSDEKDIQQSVQICLASNDIHEGQDAFREKRAADFQGR
jgi:enoyl-CoA hydratase